MPKSWITKVEEDANGELVILFPEELIQTMNWHKGDKLIWTEMPSGNGFLIHRMPLQEVNDK